MPFLQIPSLALLVLSGTVMLLAPQGRLVAVSFAILSLSWGFLLGTLGLPLTGSVHAIAGVAAATIIALAESTDVVAGRGSRRRQLSQDPQLASGFVLLSIATAVIVAYGLSHTIPLNPSSAARSASFGWYWLAVAATMSIAVRRDLSRSGPALLLFSLSGPSFPLIVGRPEDFATTLFGAAVTITIGLLLAYLRPTPTARSNSISASSAAARRADAAREPAPDVEQTNTRSTPDSSPLAEASRQ